MKTFVISLTIAFLLAVQFFTPVAAASPSAIILASETCGSTYTVQHQDNLSKIAGYCGTTVADILAYNPQITNPNIIFSGQVLNMTGSTTTSTSYSTTYTVQSGDSLSEIASMFGTTVWAINQANSALWYNSTIYAGQVLNIPESTYSVYTGYTGNARVSLSTTSAEAGDEVTVYVNGFPANSWIDYRVGEQDEAYSAVYDGTVGSDGTDSTTITIPSDADEGEYWVVLVTTTSQKDGVQVTSHTIYIED